MQITIEKFIGVAFDFQRSHILRSIFLHCLVYSLICLGLLFYSLHYQKDWLLLAFFNMGGLVNSFQFMRQQLVDKLKNNSVEHDFRFITSLIGLFSFLGLDAPQV